MLLQSYVIIASISPATERQWARSEHMLTDDQCRWKTMKQMAMLPLASTDDMLNLLAYLDRIRQKSTMATVCSNNSTRDTGDNVTVT